MATTTTHDGVKIDYTVAGADGGRPLVLIHGWCCDRRFLEPQFEHFGRSYRVAALDLRAHGSSGAGRIESVADFVADVRAVVDAEQLDEPVFIGHSLGALVALAAVAELNGAAAVLIDPAPLVGPVKETFRTLRADPFRNDETGAVRTAVIGTMFLDTDPPRLRNWILDTMCSAPLGVAIAAWDAAATFDGTRWLRSAAVPLLTIGAAAPTDQAADLCSESVQVTVGQTVGAGHFNQLVVPDQVNLMIDRFFVVHGLV